MLELKNTMTKMKNSVDGIKNRGEKSWEEIRAPHCRTVWLTKLTDCEKID
jgi:hypothetical protein